MEPITTLSSFNAEPFLPLFHNVQNAWIVAAEAARSMPLLNNGHVVIQSVFRLFLHHKIRIFHGQIFVIIRTLQDSTNLDWCWDQIKSRARLHGCSRRVFGKSEARWKKTEAGIVGVVEKLTYISRREAGA